ncbi:MAG TPA: phospholipid carrier-dependent glycosyltransferase [Candidatus Saccharimonas sp.]|nr:phospholipid carrier-dependent glycosyltransferase [Candidatus Saccharimonas sp.]
MPKSWRLLLYRPELIILTALAALTRFWGLFQPNAIVFDEVYFKTYAGDYLTGSYYFDPHPPLGKLLLGGLAYLFHLSGPAVAGTDPAVVLRLLPALAGTLIIPVFYILLRQLKASRAVAALGALLLLLDNALLVESRFILIDSMLILFGLTAITLYLAARRRQGWPRWRFMAAAAFCAGLAASTKWTGLAILGIIGLAWFVEYPPLRTARRRFLTEGATLLVIPALVYVSVFAVHFHFLTRTGQGDAFMSQRFQSTLIGSPYYDPHAKLSFIGKFVDLNRAMHDAENSLRGATHPYGSKWDTWPLMQRDVYYWQGPSLANGRQGNIYLLGNPIIWWGILVTLILGALAYAYQPGRFRRYSGVWLLLGVAYLANFLPFSQIDRVMFLYHYLYAFIFSLAAAVLALAVMTGWDQPSTKFWHFSSRQSMLIYIGVATAALAGFCYFAPLSYGWPLSQADLMHHIWLPTWR